jgi:hypothetical protein
MHVGEVLPVVVLHGEIRFAFLDRPRGREAAFVVLTGTPLVLSRGPEGQA